MGIFDTHFFAGVASTLGACVVLIVALDVLERKDAPKEKELKLACVSKWGDRKAAMISEFEKPLETAKKLLAQPMTTTIAYNVYPQSILSALTGGRVGRPAMYTRGIVCGADISGTTDEEILDSYCAAIVANKKFLRLV